MGSVGVEGGRFILLFNVIRFFSCLSFIRFVVSLLNCAFGGHDEDVDFKRERKTRPLHPLLAQMANCANMPISSSPFRPRYVAVSMSNLLLTLFRSPFPRFSGP